MLTDCRRAAVRANNELQGFVIPPIGTVMAVEKLTRTFAWGNGIGFVKANNESTCFDGLQARLVGVGYRADQFMALENVSPLNHILGCYMGLTWAHSSRSRVVKTPTSEQYVSTLSSIH